MRRGDKMLIALLALALLIGGAWLLLAREGATADSDLIVVCQTKDGFRRVDSLAQDAEYTVETGRDGENLVSIRNGSVDVLSANCDNQVCVEHAPIGAAGEQIVCLPHGMVVEIVADEADAARLR